LLVILLVILLIVLLVGGHGLGRMLII